MSNSETLLVYMSMADSVEPDQTSNSLVLSDRVLNVCSDLQFEYLLYIRYVDTVVNKERHYYWYI